jgi:hypothetical protein
MYIPQSADDSQTLSHHIPYHDTVDSERVPCSSMAHTHARYQNADEMGKHNAVALLTIIGVKYRTEFSSSSDESLTMSDFIAVTKKLN